MNRKHRHVRALAGLAVIGLVAASCGSDSDSSDDSAAPAVTEVEVDETTAPADTEPAAPAATEPADTAAPADTEPTDTDDAEGGDGFTSLAPPEGEPIIVGMVNTEGSPGLDFPELSAATRAAADFLNEHGGMGGRPIQLEVCNADGAPETSQACAQELVGKGVEMIMLGLDLFPGYDTYTAANVPVTGVLPILPGDYTANALFLGGGNTTTTAAMTGFAVEELGATTAGIISADNAGANGTEADLKAALDAAGITYVSIKGGDNETDAGFQGLMAQATADDPDVLFSLYADAGCIGTMRGRVALGIETPVLTTAICSSAEVIDEVGDDATGWYFVGAQTERTGTPEAADYQAMLDTLGYANSTELGLGNLGIDRAPDAGIDRQWHGRRRRGHHRRLDLRDARRVGWTRQLARRQPLGVWFGGVDSDHLCLHVPDRHVCVRRRNPDRSGLRGVRHHAVPAVMPAVIAVAPATR